MAIELKTPNARAIILPEYGGRLHQLFLRRGGEELPLLWGPDDPSEYAERPTRGGSFPMAPWPNRIRESRFAWAGQEINVPSDGKPNAIHGRVLDKQWEVKARVGQVVELVCPFDDGWPWAGRAWQRFELTERALIMKLEVRSDRERFPAGCGWHPWFRRDAFGADAVRVRAAAGRWYELEAQLPTGDVGRPDSEHDLADGPELVHQLLDDCYGELSLPLEIDWGAAALRISIECPEPHVQIYTPDYAFCVEPQTCAPDAFNLAERVGGTGFALAAPGEAVAITSRWEWDLRE